MIASSLSSSPYILEIISAAPQAFITRLRLQYSGLGLARVWLALACRFSAAKNNFLSFSKSDSGRDLIRVDFAEKKISTAKILDFWTLYQEKFVHLIANLYCLNAPGQFITCLVGVCLSIECIARMINIFLYSFSNLAPTKRFQRAQRENLSDGNF